MQFCPLKVLKLCYFDFFDCDLFNDAISTSACRASYGTLTDKMMDWEGCGSKWPWPDLTYYSSIYLKDYRAHKKSPENWSLFENLN
jgi:hypothetical protein